MEEAGLVVKMKELLKAAEKWTKLCNSKKITTLAEAETHLNDIPKQLDLAEEATSLCSDIETTKKWDLEFASLEGKAKLIFLATLSNLKLKSPEQMQINNDLKQISPDSYLRLLDNHNREQNCIKNLDDLIAKLNNASGAGLLMKEYFARIKQEVQNVEARLQDILEGKTSVSNTDDISKNLLGLPCLVPGEIEFNKI